MALSKTKYCRGLQCVKMLWLDENMPEVADLSLVNDSVFETGNEVGDLAMSYFGEFEEVLFCDDKNKMISDTLEKLDRGVNIIAEASFNYDGNFCSVDILKKEDDGYSIYEVKSSTEVKDIYIEDASYQYYILHNLGIKIKSVNIMYLNSKYVRGDELDLSELFLISDITDIAIDKYDYVKENISKLKKRLSDNNIPSIDIDLYCEKPYPCIYKTFCQKHLFKPNVFDISKMTFNKKYSLYKEGLITFSDILNSNIKLTDKQFNQLNLCVNDLAPIINKDKIREFLNTLSYPLYFLDFETFQQAIPLWEGVSPYMQIPFQYSLHYINNKNGVLLHKEFLAKEGENPMRALAERLVNDIPRDVCVLAYNMGFEKGVIKRLAYMFDDLYEHLMNIHNNIKDLMIPFYNQDYYMKEMKGSYSIKYVLPALFPNDKDLNYSNLDDIHNGSEAMNAYLNLASKSEEEIKNTRDNLLKYCYLDTLAMVKILEKLEEVSYED